MAQGLPTRLVNPDGTSVALPPNPSLHYGSSSLAASYNDTLVKASPAYLFTLRGYNAATYPICLRLYNSASTPNSPGGGYFSRIRLEPSAAFKFDWPVGLLFSNGLGFGVSKDFAASATQQIVAGDILMLGMEYA